MDKKVLDRINELARKSKVQKLTEEELKEQADLRRQYIDAYKKNLVSQLENMTIVEPDGTKRKIKRKQ